MCSIRGILIPAIDIGNDEVDGRSTVSGSCETGVFWLYSGPTGGCVVLVEGSKGAKNDLICEWDGPTCCWLPFSLAGVTWACCWSLTRGTNVVASTLDLLLLAFRGAFSPFLPRLFGIPNVMALEIFIPPALRLVDESHLRKFATLLRLIQAATECPQTDDDEKPGQSHSVLPLGYILTR